MNNLLELQSVVKAVPHPATTKIKEFERLLEETEKPVRHLAYIYHMHNPESDYSGYSDDLREEEVKNDLYGDKDWEPGDVVLEAERKYQEITETPEQKLLRKAVNSVYKLMDYLDEFDPTERDENGKLVWKTKDYIRNMEKLNSVVDSLEELRERVNKGEDAGGDIRGGVELNEFNKG